MTSSKDDESDFEDAFSDITQDVFDQNEMAEFRLKPVRTRKKLLLAKKLNELREMMAVVRKQAMLSHDVKQLERCDKGDWVIRTIAACSNLPQDGEPMYAFKAHIREIQEDAPVYMNDLMRNEKQGPRSKIPDQPHQVPNFIPSSETMWHSLPNKQEYKRLMRQAQNDILNTIGNEKVKFEDPEKELHENLYLQNQLATEHFVKSMKEEPES